MSQLAHTFRNSARISWRCLYKTLLTLPLVIAGFAHADTLVFWPDATEAQWHSFAQSWDRSRDPAPSRISSATQADLHILAGHHSAMGSNAAPLSKPPTIWFAVERSAVRKQGTREVWVWASPSPERILTSFKDVLPQYHTPGVLFGPNNQTQFQQWQAPLVAQFPLAHTRFFRAAEKPSRVFQSLLPHIDSVILLKNTHVDASEALIILQEATRHRLPVFTDNVQWIPFGAAIALDHSDQMIGAQYANLAQQILHNPSLAPQEPAFSFVINQQIIRSLNVTVSQPTKALD